MVRGCTVVSSWVCVGPAWMGSILLLLFLTGCASAPTISPTEAALPSSTPAPSPTTSPPSPTPTPTTADHPLVPTPSESLGLDGEWRFSIDPDGVGEAEGWADPGFDDSSWTKVAAPHTWNVMKKHSAYQGVAWYRRSFTLPAEAEDAHLELRFEAVFYLAQVWLNGEYLGQHEGGYTPFAFDVSQIARPGARNVVAVRVDNARADDRIPADLRDDWSFDWWNYGGLVRGVSLEMTSRAFIARQRVVAVPHLVAWDEADAATITATVAISNTSAERLDGSLTADVFKEAAAGPVLESPWAVPIRLGPGQRVTVQLTVRVSTPSLWHFDHPHLYRWSASLLDDSGRVLDADDVTFGIRLIELKDARFYLNGEPMRLVGLTRHADSPEHGLAETVTVMAADYEDLKRLNTVFSRPVHYPQDGFILDYCDRHGILLIPEIPAWQLTASQLADDRMRGLARQQLREMIAADVNHPSVWAWSVGNEFESRTKAGHDYVEEMIELARSLDPTRPVGFASNRLNSRPQHDATALADFVMMNQYFGTWVGPKRGLGRALDWIHQTWPQKVVIISEFGFEPHWNASWGPPSDTLDPRRYYVIPENVPSDSEEPDIQRRRVITEQMGVFRDKPFVSAAIFWTYQDYRTPSGFTMGVVGKDRERRGSWHVLREAYAPALIDTVRLLPASDGRRTAEVTLHTRGPIEQDMPAYTLRGYSVRWTVSSADGEKVFSVQDVPLPTLEPGARWSGEVVFDVPGGDYDLTVTILRPTGFAVSSQSYSSSGQAIDADRGLHQESGDEE